MRKNDLFLHWVLFATLIGVGLVIASVLGLLKRVYAIDAVLPLTTTLVFLLGTASIGKQAYRVSRGYDPEIVEIDLMHGHFAAGLCVSLGLLGTSIGLLIMLLHGNDSGELVRFVRAAFANTSIAVVNTVLGAICGILLEVQCHFVAHAVRHELLKLDRAEERREAESEAGRAQA